MSAEQFLIYSNHHKSWWGPNGSGYRAHIADAGRYQLADTTQWLGRGCNCCKVPEIVVPAPTAETIADPDALAKYAVTARQVATRKAKREGRINQWAEAVSR